MTPEYIEMKMEQAIIQYHLALILEVLHKRREKPFKKKVLYLIQDHLDSVLILLYGDGKTDL